eukprot:95625-Amphidinium_carterae.2
MIQTVQKQLLATKPPYMKPPPAGLEHLALAKPKGPPPPPCPVLSTLERLNGYDPLPPPPKEKPAPKERISARIPGPEKAALERADRAKREKQPPLKGSVEARKAPLKPPSGFPSGTSVPLGFTVLSGGRMLYQPALLPQNMIMPQTAAIDLGQLPDNNRSLDGQAGPTQVLVVNGQVMLATATAENVVNTDSCAATDNSYSQPSEVVMRLKCSFCNTADASHYPLKVCWFEGDDGKKCGKRFCFNSRRKCGSRVAYNTKPPSPLGVKDFPDYLWCKDHDKILLAHHPFMRKRTLSYALLFLVTPCLEKMTTFDRMQVSASTSKRSSVLDTDDTKEEHYRQRHPNE